MRLLAVLAGVMVLALGVVPGHAQSRVALVIGNSAYANVPALPNPANDARAVAASFKRLGFEVTTLTDANFDVMRRGLINFGRRSRGAEMAVVYFAGHGMEVGGENWLIPTDAELAADTDTEDEAVSLHSVMLQVAGATKLGMVILDACRNNPFAAKMQRSSRVRAVERGLSRVEPADNVLVAYAARDGTTASDGDGRNSPFTAALLKNIERPGLEIRFLFAAVRDEVMTATRRQQQPFIYQSLPEQPVYLRAPGQVAAVGPQVAPVAPPPVVGPCEGGAKTVAFSSRCAAPLSASEERALKPKQAFRECAQCPEMVVVPAGSFTMGSPDTEKDRHKDEGPQHAVTFARSFAVGKFDVTVDQFAAFVAARGYDAGSNCSTWDGSAWVESQGRSWREPGFPQAGSHPAVCLSWNDAKAYVDWLARTTGKGYRLLTEAEWEYAERGRTAPGTYPRYPFGDNEKDLCRYGNVGDQTAKDAVPGAGRGALAPCSDGYAYTSPAGSFPPNGFGLYDMVGNARQWTEDCLHNSYDGAPLNGSAWTAESPNSSQNAVADCSRRIIRGGTWFNSPRLLRAASRVWNPTDIRNHSVGFRVARTLMP
jgi:formylglycine-generating enzyme required for sulfatase activity